LRRGTHCHPPQYANVSSSLSYSFF
jgi:hypothetical protein